MRFRMASVVFIALLVTAAPLWAQYRQPPPRRPRNPGWGFQSQQHRIEIAGYFGYLWSGALDGYYGPTYGSVDLADGEIWGIEADINVRPGAQMVLLYQRQDTELKFKSGPINEVVGDVGVEHWQIGGMSGVQNGNVMPFGMFTLGATRLIPKFGANNDQWKFSIMFGLGAKIYLNERLGIRIQGHLPWIFTSGGAAFGCGSGGCFTSFAGTGIVQADVSGGVFLMF